MWHAKARSIALALLPLPFAAGVLAGVILTTGLVAAAVDSDGHIDRFEAQIRHYTDSLTSENGRLVFMATPHPLLQYIGAVTGAWCVAAGAAYAHHCIRKHRE